MDRSYQSPYEFSAFLPHNCNTSIRGVEITIFSQNIQRNTIFFTREKAGASTFYTNSATFLFSSFYFLLVYYFFVVTATPRRQSLKSNKCDRENIIQILQV